MNLKETSRITTLKEKMLHQHRYVSIEPVSYTHLDVYKRQI